MSQALGSQVYSSDSLLEGMSTAQEFVNTGGRSWEQIKAELEAR